MAEFVEDKGWTIDEDSTVHGEWAQTFRALTAAGDRDGLEKATHQMLGGKRIRFWKRKSPEKLMKLQQVKNNRGQIQTDEFDRLGSINDFDRAYSAMEQGDLLYIFWDAFQLTGNKTYRKLAFAAGDVLVDDWNDGGLLIGGGWFAAQTSVSQKDQGRTLNKHLMAIRNLWAIGEEGGVGDYKNAALKAIKFTVGSGGLDDRKDGVPNIYDYVPRTSAGVIIPNSWAFYGIGGKDNRYMLSANLWKNAQYHTFDMNLIYIIRQEMGSLFPLAQWQAQWQLGGQSILKRMGDAYRLKAKAGLFIEHTCAKPGNFSAFLPARFQAPYSGTLALFS